MIAKEIRCPADCPRRQPEGCQHQQGAEYPNIKDRGDGIICRCTDKGILIPFHMIDYCRRWK